MQKNRSCDPRGNVNVTGDHLLHRILYSCLQIISMEGYGTDAYLHLNRLGNVQEPLP